MSGGVDGCDSLDFLKTTMEMYIADCRHQSNLKDMISSFKKGIAAEIPHDASAMAAAKATSKSRWSAKSSKGSTSRGFAAKAPGKTNGMVHHLRVGTIIPKNTRKRHHANMEMNVNRCTPLFLSLTLSKKQLRN